MISRWREAALSGTSGRFDAWLAARSLRTRVGVRVLLGLTITIGTSLVSGFEPSRIRGTMIWIPELIWLSVVLVLFTLLIGPGGRRIILRALGRPATPTSAELEQMAEARRRMAEMERLGRLIRTHCPHCHEPISPGATRCPHCTSRFE
ncbi:MAG: hypothetical protein M3Y17_12890 [Actinomycetota bacterium]|nr:hypothetical protein [Actinomycetota bacterium]